MALRNKHQAIQSQLYLEAVTQNEQLQAGSSKRSKPARLQADSKVQWDSSWQQLLDFAIAGYEKLT